MLGSTVVPILENAGFEVFTGSVSNPKARLKVNAFSKSSMLACLEANNFDTVINFIGATSVEACELDPFMAFRVNSLPSTIFREIVLANERIESRWVQISTDHVYGDPGPSSESEIRIVNTYAASKFAGESAARPDRDLVLRTNFVGPSMADKRESLTDWILEMSSSGRNQVPVLSDVYFSPLTMSTVGFCLVRALQEEAVGRYNLGASSGGSKADFDISFAMALGLNPSFMNPIQASDAQFLVAPRPKDMTMNVSRFEDLVGMKLPSFDEVAVLAAQEHKDAKSNKIRNERRDD